MINCIAIDDDPLFLQKIKAHFSEYEGMELVGMYSNPIDGIMNVVKLKPDVLLIDMEMPYLDGFEALDSLDKKPKVIMISAHVDQPRKDKRIKIDRYLRKTQITSVFLEREIRQIVS